MMILQTLFLINALVAFVSGIGFVVTPSIVLPLCGVSPDSTNIVFVRMLGGEFLSYAALTWIGRNLTEFEGQRAIALGCLIGFLIGCAALLMAKYAGVFNVLAWSWVACYFLFSAGYAYFLFKGRKQAAV